MLGIHVHLQNVNSVCQVVDLHKLAGNLGCIDIFPAHGYALVVETILKRRWTRRGQKSAIIGQAEALFADGNQLRVGDGRIKQLCVDPDAYRLSQIPRSDPSLVGSLGPDPIRGKILEVIMLVALAEDKKSAATAGIPDDQIGLADVSGAAVETQEQLLPRSAHAASLHGAGISAL